MAAFAGMKRHVIAAVFILSAVVAVESQQTCPVQIEKIGNGAKAGMMAGLLGAGPLGHPLEIRYANRSDKPVAAIRFGVGYLNSMHELSYVGTVDTKDSHLLKPGKSYGVVSSEIFGTEKKPMAWVEKVRFSDDTYWSDDGSRSCGNFQPPPEIPSNTDSTKSLRTPAPRLVSSLPSTEVARMIRAGARTTYISSYPIGSEVMMEGKSLGLTPLIFVLQPSEQYDVSVIADGYKPVTAKLRAGLVLVVQMEKGDPQKPN